MKYRIFAIIAAAVMLISSITVNQLKSESPVQRVHQHLSASYPSGECKDVDELCTHLPIIRIDTQGQEIPGNPILDKNYEEIGYTTTPNGESEILVKIETVEKDGEWHYASSEADYSSSAYFRIRGNSSRNFSKKSYRIKLVSDENYEENQELPLLGMPADNDWALHGPFLDKTLIRNYMWMNISAEIMGYAPNVRFCEVILNGEYVGVYVLMETIKEDDFRVNLSDYEAGSSVSSYMVLVDEYEENDFGDVNLDNYTFYTWKLEFFVDSRTSFSILYPKTEELTEEVIEFIEQDISQIERGLYSSDMLINRYNYESELDVDSFVDYYILQEFLGNNDAFSRSTYLYRDIRGKLHIGPVWDYNNVLNNFFWTFPYDGFLLANRGWYGRLMTDEEFVERVIDRYRELREGILSDEYLIHYMREVINYLGPAIERNDEVWGYSYDPELLSLMERHRPDSNQTLEDVNPSSYEDAITRMIDYMLVRGEWLDENIESLRQYSHPSKTASQRVE